MSFDQNPVVRITDPMPEEPIISPVSIDLGAKNTGVYFAHYPAGSSIEDIKDEYNIKIIAAEIINQDADRCMAPITVSSIKNLSLPQNVSYWKGKVFCYKNDEDLKEAEKKDRRGNHHCLSAQWKWFENPFALPGDYRDVEIETNHDGKVITFTVSKSSILRKWLSGKET